MKNRIIKILAFIIILALVIMISTHTFAGITPGQITGSGDGTISELDFFDDITEGIRGIGIFIAVGALMIIGIKYITGSIEEKANYKKSMMPYIIGCIILFGASAIAPEIKNLVGDDVTDTASVGNKILGIIRIVGTLTAVGVLMVLGIKYMLGSIEERASYKKSMMPYVIGMIVLFASVNIASGISDFVAATMPVALNPANAADDVRAFFSVSHTSEERINEYEEAKRKYQEATDPDEKEYWRRYSSNVYEYIRWTDL